MKDELDSRLETLKTNLDKVQDVRAKTENLHGQMSNIAEQTNKSVQQAQMALSEANTLKGELAVSKGDLEAIRTSLLKDVEGIAKALATRPEFAEFRKMVVSAADARVKEFSERLGRLDAAESQTVSSEQFEIWRKQASPNGAKRNVVHQW